MQALLIVFYLFNSQGQKVDTIHFQTDIVDVEKCERVAKKSAHYINLNLKKKNMTAKFGCMEMDEYVELVETTD